MFSGISKSPVVPLPFLDQSPFQLNVHDFAGYLSLQQNILNLLHVSIT